MGINDNRFTGSHILENLGFFCLFLAGFSHLFQGLFGKWGGIFAFIEVYKYQIGIGALIIIAFAKWSRSPFMKFIFYGLLIFGIGLTIYQKFIQ